MIEGVDLKKMASDARDCRDLDGFLKTLTPGFHQVIPAFKPCLSSTMVAWAKVFVGSLFFLIFLNHALDQELATFVGLPASSSAKYDVLKYDVLKG